MNIDRPLDLLGNNKGKELIVYCDKDKVYSGTLVTFDIHLNIVLDNMKDISEKTKKSLGLSLIRGDKINIISPISK